MSETAARQGGSAAGRQTIGPSTLDPRPSTLDQGDILAARLVAAYRRTQDDETLPTLLLLGASGFTTLLLVGVAGFVGEAHVGKLGYDIQVIGGIAEVGHMAFHALGAPLALFLVAASLMVRRARLAPGWLGVAGLVVAPLAFAHGAAVLEAATVDQTLHGLGILGFQLALLWVFVTGIALARRAIIRQPAFRTQVVPA